MTTHAASHAGRTCIDVMADAVSNHWLWLTGGFALAFLLPFVFADSLQIDRDLYYGIYGAAVLAYVGLWARVTGQSIRRLAARRLAATLALALVAGLIVGVIVYRTEEATSHPDGPTFWAAIAWRGVFYGAVDGVLLSVFPILAVFAAFAGHRLRQHRTGTAAVAALALVASLAMTAIYHVGYSDFRGEKLRKPLVGDVVWSAPTLLTLNPVGAPIAHVSLHTTAVVHSYETDTFLPPHTSE